MRDLKYIEKEKWTRKTGIEFKALVERLSFGRITFFCYDGKKGGNQVPEGEKQEHVHG